MTSQQMRQFIGNDPAASFWLKQAIEDAAKRDPVDAHIDARALLEFCTKRIHESAAG